MRVRQGLTIPFLVLLATNCAVTALADLDAVSPGPPLTNSKRFLVHLKVATSPEGSLPNSDAVARQRRAIGAAKAAIRTALAGRPHRVMREYHALPLLAIEGGTDVLAVLGPMVTTVYPDHLFRVSLPESVPLVRANQAWVQGFDGSGSVVAVLDTGVDKLHPFLAGKVISEACYTGNASCPNGTDTQLGPGAGVSCTFAGACQHGTHVAGIAAGSGATFSGVAKGSQIMAIQVYSKFTGTACDGAGEDPCALAYTSDLIAAMEHVYELRNLYRIAAVNMSLGGDVYTSTSQCDADNVPTKAIIDTLRSVGIATVIAAGNNGASTGITAPGCISSAISVGSTTKSDTISSFSNSASFLSVLAPGSSILSSVPGGGFAVFSGTSMATPHVAGAWAVVKQKSPQASVAAVLDALVTTGALLTDPRNGITKPRIDVAGAVALVAGQGAASLTVNGSSAGITVGGGAVITVGVQNAPGSPTDCITLDFLDFHGFDGVHHQFFTWVTGSTMTTSFAMPTAPGVYAARYWQGCAMQLAISPTVTVQNAVAASLTVNGSSAPITVAADSTITVIAANLAANDSNIVALFATGTANSQSLTWVYLTGNQTMRSGALDRGDDELWAAYHRNVRSTGAALGLGDRVCDRRHEPHRYGARWQRGYVSRQWQQCGDHRWGWSGHHRGGAERAGLPDGLHHPRFPRFSRVRWGAPSVLYVGHGQHDDHCRSRCHPPPACTQPATGKAAPCNWQSAQRSPCNDNSKGLSSWLRNDYASYSFCYYYPSRLSRGRRMWPNPLDRSP